MGISQKITRLYGAKGWAAIGAFMLVVLVVFPVFNLVVPKDSAFHLSDYFVALAGKIMCYAMVALAMDLIWGYTGILSLGHGVFFRWAATPWACISCARSGSTAYITACYRTSWCFSTGKRIRGTGLARRVFGTARC